MRSICTTDDNGNKAWYLNGKLHREDGPAYEWSTGDEPIWLNGKLIVSAKEWYLNGVPHRTDGAAIEHVYYLFHGPPDYRGANSYNSLQFLNNGPVCIKHQRIKGQHHAVEREWWINGKLHREDGPAIERANGDKCWYLNGKLHREDEPAIIYADDDEAFVYNGEHWYLNGKLHREDGPAVVSPKGYERWYLNGKFEWSSSFGKRPPEGFKWWQFNGKCA